VSAFAFFNFVQPLAITFKKRYIKNNSKKLKLNDTLLLRRYTAIANNMIFIMAAMINGVR